MTYRVAAAAIALTLGFSGIASAQTIGGFPIREPGSTSAGSKAPAAKKKKGPSQIIVDVNGPGPYRSIRQAVNDIAEGGVIYVMHGVYNEAISLNKSVFIQGDRGPGSGVEINAPMNQSCLSFRPSEATSHAVVANVQFSAKINSGAPACVDVASGVFTLKESDVLGSTTRPSIRITGGTVTLKKNRISAGSEGIYVEQAHSLMNTSIISNIISNNRIGVDIAAGSRADVVLTGNEIYENVSTGVKSSGYGEASIIGNKIRNNQGAGLILDKYAKNSIVRRNEIIKNEGDGVAIPFGANGFIEDNEIRGNSGLSIFVREGLKPKITNNIIENNRGDGKKRRRRR
ncbi:MAG: right-handed parallel beta-helix repeat-containing protein [Pseudomonadota bacterium]